VRNQQAIKLFIVLSICTAFMYSFSHFGALAYNAMTDDRTQYDKGTTVGSIDLTGKTKSEALTLLTEQLQKWRNETIIQLQYKEKTIPVDLSIYHFDLENTIEVIANGQKTPVIVSIKPTDFKKIVEQVSPTINLTAEETNKLNDDLLQYSKELTAGNHTVHIATVANSMETISYVELKLNDVTVEMNDWVKALSPIMIDPQETISLVKLFEEKNLKEIPDSIKSMFATGIYESILPTNFIIIERHTGQFLPDYAKLGYEANIDMKNKRDLLFTNPNSTSYQLKLDWKDNTLVIEVMGSSFLYDYVVKLGEVEKFKPKTIVQYNPLLKDGIRVQQEGTNGLMVKVYREVSGEAGVVLQKDLVAEDYYPPVHRIEIHRLPSSTTGESTAVTNPTGSEIQSTTTSTQTPNNAANEELWGKPDEARK
jgi:vancomycin resistance protein YoaR